MKIRMNLANLNEAFGFASTVKPAQKDGLSAFLFTVSDGRCYIHSQDAQDYVRTEVQVTSIDGADDGVGSFVYPADRVDALKYLDGWIEIESGEDGGRYWTNYKTEGGAKASRSTFNPRSFNTMDTAIAEAANEYTFPTILLKEGIAVTASYTASNPPEEEAQMSCVQLFDKSTPEWAKGDGTLFAADGQRACYFHAAELAGKGLAIQQKHIPRLTSFLNKCQHQVKVRVGKLMAFVIDQIPDPQGGFRDGAVFGWVLHSKLHQRYKYHPSKFDKFRLRVPRDYVLKTLKYIKSEMKDANRDKIRVIYNKPDLKFLGSVNKETTESAPVGCTPQPLEDGVESGDEFAANVDVKALIGLFEASREPDVELRVAFLEDGKKAFFRTVGKAIIGDSGKTYISAADAKEPTYECLVTHFTTSMD
jgi:hypothetical protein